MASYLRVKVVDDDHSPFDKIVKVVNYLTEFPRNDAEVMIVDDHPFDLRIKIASETDFRYDQYERVRILNPEKLPSRFQPAKACPRCGSLLGRKIGLTRTCLVCGFSFNG